MPRTLIAAVAVLLCSCNEIRYQSARLRANAPPLEIPKVASLPDHRVTYDCKDGEPFDALFPPGGKVAVITLGGEEFALPALAPIAGLRYGDGRYELYIKEDGVAQVTLEEKKIRVGCKQR